MDGNRKITLVGACTRFEQKVSEITSPIPTASDAPVPTITATDIRSDILRARPWKATGLDGVPSHALGSCADQLAGLFADIFNFSLLQCKVPTYFKMTTIIRTEYRKEIECLAKWRKDNNLSINISKMKKLVIDFRKRSGVHAPICINGAEMEMVDSIKFLGVTNTNDLSWSTHVDRTVKKAQNLYFPDSIPALDN
eukprot:g25396.t1